MGTLDEHWCNVCKRKLDKNKDKYVEFELVNLPFSAQIRMKRPKGIVCESCVDGNSELKKAVELMIKAGNPLFRPVVSCESTQECGTYEVSENPRINCVHIAVIGDKVYCNRSHVGSLVLPREAAEVRREESQAVLKFMEKYLKSPKMKELLETALLEKDFLKTVYLAPSAIVEHVEEVQE